jgi:hypothetical protein
MAAQRAVNDWKVWLLIWGLGALGALAVIPYLMDALGEPIRQAAEKSGLSVTAVLAAQTAQGIVLLGICSRIGIWAARRSGLTLPIFDALASRRPVPWHGRAAAISTMAGLFGGAIVVLLDVFVFAPAQQVALAGSTPAAWEGLLASFYGGISEEIFLRLFLLSLLVLAARRLMLGRGPSDGPLPMAAFWTANILAALAFGLGHLPATAAIAPLTASLVIRALLLNGLLALLFGELYRRWGFEMAILAHFCADLALHVVPPLVG